VRKYIPVPVSEVVIDWSVIPKSDVNTEDSAEYMLPANPPASSSDTKSPPVLGKVDVLVVAIHNSTIARYKEIVTKSGLEDGFFEIEIFSTMRAVLDESLRPVMIIDMGAASTKLYVIERSIIRTSHTINRGSQDISAVISKSMGLPLEQAEVMKRREGMMGDDQNLKDLISLVLDGIFAEVNSALLSFEKKYHKTISKVVLVGGGSALKGLSDYAQNNFKTDVVIADPFSKVTAPAFLEKILKATGPEFAVAIGLALRKLSE
jgi:type IV pilus assembly protein PilM